MTDLTTHDPPAPAPAPEPPDARREPKATPPGLSLGRMVLGAILILLGVLWLLDAAGVTELRWRVVLPAALTVVGVALVASARRGAHGGLVTVGIILSVLLMLSAATPLAGPADGMGERVERPTDVVAVEREQSLGIGSLTVDLRAVEDLPDGATVTASVGIGELVVRLPEGVGARVEANTGIGDVTVLGRSRSGFGVSVSDEISGEPEIVLDLSVGIGKVEVRQ